MATTPVKKHFSFTIKDFYKDYRSNEKALGRELTAITPYKIYKGIIEEFFILIMKRVIYENHVFMMPYSLGTIMVKSFKSNLKKAPIDFNTSKKIGKTVKFLNLHTFGYYFGIIWDKSYVRFRNNIFYKFSSISSDAATKLGIGKKALSKHITELSKDPERRSYIKV